MAEKAGTLFTQSWDMRQSTQQRHLQFGFNLTTRTQFMVDSMVKSGADPSDQCANESGQSKDQGGFGPALA